MRNKFTKIIMITCLTFFAGSTYSSPPVKVADEPVEAVPVVKKKRAGEACKTSDECQRHHTCNNVGDKSVCVAPPYAEIPKT